MYYVLASCEYWGLSKEKGDGLCPYKEHILWDRGKQVTSSNNKISEEKKMEQE